MIELLKIATFLIGFSMLSIGVLAQQTINKLPLAAKSTAKIGVTVNAVGEGERFEFSVGGATKITITQDNVTVNFANEFLLGQNYTVSQLSGPRTCQLTNHVGTVGNSNIVVRADCGNPQARHKVGIALGPSLMASTDRFEFSAGGNKKVIITKPGIAYFAYQFASGESYSISQTSGPRQCNLVGNRQGTITDHDVIVHADCGYPPLTIIKLNIIGVESGETFKFVDSTGRTLTIPFSALANLGGFPTGDNFSVTQTGGPRNCIMSNNQGVVGNAEMTATADCRKSIPPTPVPNKQEWDLISRSTDNKNFGTFYDSTAPVIGGKDGDEGRYVAFVSYAVGLGGSLGKFRQIIWRDRNTGVTKIVSVGMNGIEGNGNSFAPSISSDGQSVAFESYATNLVPIDTNGVRDIFVWSAKTNSVTAVSTGASETETNAESFEPVISGDGSLVAFSSSASNLAAGVSGTSAVNVYLKEVGSGRAPVLISVDEKTKKGGGGSNPSISEDGSRIAFYNYFPLTSDDKNNLWDIYLWQRGNPKLKRLSVANDGMERNQGDDSSSRVVAPAISGNGQFVTFSTTATNLVSGDTNKVQDAFVVEVSSGRVQRVSLGKEGQESDLDSPIGQGEKIAISHDGKWVVFSSNAKNLGGNILLKNVLTGETKIISTSHGITVGRPDISGNGNFVVFGTSQRLDSRFQSSGLFVNFTNVGRSK